MRKNVLEIIGEIGWDVTAGEVRNKLKGMTGDIEVHIASGGGNVFAGVDMYNAIRSYDKGTTTAVISSIGASMGSYIPLACDKVVVHDNTSFMIHNASMGAWGDHNDLREAADFVEAVRDMLANAYMSKTGTDKEAMYPLLDKETWFFGQEIVDAGFADEIISTESNNDKSSSIASAKVSFLNCKKSTEAHMESSTIGEKMVAMMDTIKMGENPLDATATAQIDQNSNKESNLDLQAQLDEVNGKLSASLEANSKLNTDLTAGKESVASLEAKLVDSEAKAKTDMEDAVAKAKVTWGEGADAKAEATKNIVAMGFEKGADKETVMAMMAKNSVESASVVLLDAMGTTGATTVPSATAEQSEEKLQERCEAVDVTFIEG